MMIPFHAALHRNRKDFNNVFSQVAQVVPVSLNEKASVAFLQKLSNHFITFFTQSFNTSFLQMLLCVMAQPVLRM